MKIVEQGGGHVLPVKDNHPKLHADVTDYFEGLRREWGRMVPAAKDLDRHENIDAGHGRIEMRTCVLSRDLRSITQRTD